MDVDLGQFLHLGLDSAALTRRGPAAPLSLDLSHVWCLLDRLIIEHRLVSFLLFVLDGELLFLLAPCSGWSFGSIDDIRHLVVEDLHL